MLVANEAPVKRCLVETMQVLAWLKQTSLDKVVDAVVVRLCYSVFCCKCGLEVSLYYYVLDLLRNLIQILNCVKKKNVIYKQIKSNRFTLLVHS